MNYLKDGLQPSSWDEPLEKAKPLTPKSERRRRSYGSLLVSVQTVDDLCALTRKCVLKEGHTVPCWPGD